MMGNEITKWQREIIERSAQRATDLTAMTAERDRLAAELAACEHACAVRQRQRDEFMTQIAAIDAVMLDDDYEYRFGGADTLARVVELDCAYREATAELAALRASFPDDAAGLLRSVLASAGYALSPLARAALVDWAARIAAAGEGER